VCQQGSGKDILDKRRVKKQVDGKKLHKDDSHNQYSSPNILESSTQG
jgi:hypothetical protein